MDIRSFMESHYRHFNAGELTRCASSLVGFLNSGGRLVLTLAGACLLYTSPSPRDS